MASWEMKCPTQPPKKEELQKTGPVSLSEVRLTILVPEDSEEPYALWCVFGDHPPFAAILGDVDVGGLSR